MCFEELEVALRLTCCCRHWRVVSNITALHDNITLDNITTGTGGKYAATDQGGLAHELA
jgi:hypothetical protein